MRRCGIIAFAAVILCAGTAQAADKVEIHAGGSSVYCYATTSTWTLSDCSCPYGWEKNQFVTLLRGPEIVLSAAKRQHDKHWQVVLVGADRQTQRYWVQAPLCVKAKPRKTKE